MKKVIVLEFHHRLSDKSQYYVIVCVDFHIVCWDVAKIEGMSRTQGERNLSYMKVSCFFLLWFLLLVVVSAGIQHYFFPVPCLLNGPSDANYLSCKKNMTLGQGNHHSKSASMFQATSVFYRRKLTTSYCCKEIYFVLALFPDTSIAIWFGPDFKHLQASHYQQVKSTAGTRCLRCKHYRSVVIVNMPLKCLIILGWIVVCFFFLHKLSILTFLSFQILLHIDSAIFTNLAFCPILRIELFVPNKLYLSPLGDHS